MVRGAIAEAVNQTNVAIKGSLRDGHPTDHTLPLQSADRIAGKVWGQLFAAFPTNEAVDTMLASPSMRARYPGLITVYRPEQFIYDDPLLLMDVTKLVRTFFRGATINIDGTLVGTDKIIHFLNLGRIYHSSYLGARKRGLSEAEATAQAVQLSAGANPFLSENALLGMISTGIRSNGDLAANYAGLKFYRNLTETVRIGDKVLPPMLVRDGPYWRLDDHVQDESDFFAAFVTPHWNEALNPRQLCGARRYAREKDAAHSLPGCGRLVPGRARATPRPRAVRSHCTGSVHVLWRGLRIPGRWEGYGQHRHHLLSFDLTPCDGRRVWRGGQSRIA